MSYFLISYHRLGKVRSLLPLVKCVFLLLSTGRDELLVVLFKAVVFITYRVIIVYLDVFVGFGVKNFFLMDLWKPHGP